MKKSRKKSTFPAKHAFFFAPTQLKKHPKKVVEKKSFFYSEGLPQKTVPFSKKKKNIKILQVTRLTRNVNKEKKM